MMTHYINKLRSIIIIKYKNNTEEHLGSFVVFSYRKWDSNIKMSTAMKF